MHLGPPIGYLDTGLSCEAIVDLLGESTVTTADGGQIVLASKTAQCELTLWLAPDKGWMPQRIEYVREGR